jgi:hypothetical protein
MILLPIDAYSHASKILATTYKINSYTIKWIVLVLSISLFSGCATYDSQTDESASASTQAIIDNKNETQYDQSSLMRTPERKTVKSEKAPEKTINEDSKVITKKVKISSTKPKALNTANTTKKLKKNSKAKVTKTVKTKAQKQLPKQSQTALTETKEPISPTPVLLNSLNDLPVLIGDKWSIDRSLSQDKSSGCTLSYKAQAMEDGQGSTPVHLAIASDSLILKTKSNIDTSYPDSGVAVDDKPLIAIEKLFNPSAIIYQTHYEQIIEQMSAGEKAYFSIGFWPTWPITKTYTIDFELKDFTNAYQALQSCLQLEQKLK